MGTNDAVAFSATAAPALMVAIASVMATNVVPMGTLSEDDVSAAASLVADAPDDGALGALFAPASATLDLHLKRIEIGAPRFGTHLVAMISWGRAARAMVEQ